MRACFPRPMLHRTGRLFDEKGSVRDNGQKSEPPFLDLPRGDAVLHASQLSRFRDACRVCVKPSGLTRLYSAPLRCRSQIFLRDPDRDARDSKIADDCSPGINVRAFFLFAPGAGAPASHPWMQNWKGLLGEIGDVETFDYNYMREGRKRPDPLPQLITAHRDALGEARERHASRSTILSGKSMGGRVGWPVSLEETVVGLVCLGYPLCAMGDRTKIRDEILRALNTPILFVQGTRDSLCPLDLLEKVRAEMKAPNFLHVVEGGDHSLRVPKRQLQASGETQEHVDRGILKAITGFVDRLNPFVAAAAANAFVTSNRCLPIAFAQTQKWNDLSGRPNET